MLRKRQEEQEVDKQQEEAAARGDWPRQEGSRDTVQTPVQPKVQTYADRVRSRQGGRDPAAQREAGEEVTLER